MIRLKKIKQVLKGENLNNYSYSFKYWVKKTKKFELLSYPELNLVDVLCLPIKKKVSFTGLLVDTRAIFFFYRMKMILLFSVIIE